MLYTKKLTRSNSTEIYVYEPDNVHAQSGTGMAVGKDANGIKKFFYIRLPADRPKTGFVKSAKIRLAQSDYGTAAPLTVMCSPVTGLDWGITTKWLAKPTFEESVHADLLINSEPTSASGGYDYRTDKRWRYRKWRASDGQYLGYEDFTYYAGIAFLNTSETYYYEYVGIVYLTYIKYREWDITTVYQYLINHGLDSIVFWFDTSGPSGTHKYFWCPVTTNTNLQPLLTVEHEDIQLFYAPEDGAINKRVLNLRCNPGPGEGAISKRVLALWRSDGSTWKKIL
jgi:hypothetical protein